MKYAPEKYHRHSVRLKGYDYSQAGAYFITICTYQRECILSDIVEGQVLLNEYGEIVFACWNDLPNHYYHVALDLSIIMPNHVHGIIELNDNAPVGEGLQTLPYSNNNLMPPKRHSLLEIIRGFKTYSARRINEKRNTPGIPVWQRSFYEHVIRCDDEKRSIQEYIENNPARWLEDHENPFQAE